MEFESQIWLYLVSNQIWETMVLMIENISQNSLFMIFVEK